MYSNLCFSEHFPDQSKSQNWAVMGRAAPSYPKKTTGPRKAKILLQRTYPTGKSKPQFSRTQCTRHWMSHLCQSRALTLSFILDSCEVGHQEPFRGICLPKGSFGSWRPSIQDDLYSYLSQKKTREGLGAQKCASFPDPLLALGCWHRPYSKLHSWPSWELGQCCCTQPREQTQMPAGH